MPTVADRIANLRVLVVDDDKDMVEVVEVVLREIGVRYITSFTRSSEAQLWFAARGGYADLVICDLMMPDVDGMQILQIARKHLPTVKFIMLTANATMKAVNSARDGRVDAYMTKPISVGSLRTRIRDVIAAMPQVAKPKAPAAPSAAPPVETPAGKAPAEEVVVEKAK